MNVKIIMLIIIIVSLNQNLFSQPNTYFNGSAEYYYLAGLNDGRLKNLPYRMFNLNGVYQTQSFELNTKAAIEYTPVKDSRYLSNSTPQDFILDLREFYLTWYFNFGEFRIGKQIHSWGCVDENSPVDVLNPYDYYYIFLQGTDRKTGVYSSMLELYFNNTKLSAIYSPFHNTNRLPIDDYDFPIKLPVVPEEYRIFAIQENPQEFGLSVEQSFSKGELKVFHFQGYDRIFNFSGINGFYFDSTMASTPDIDIVYGFRKTTMLGYGGVLLLGNLTLKGDYALFVTKDMNSSIQRENPDEIFGEIYTYLGNEFPLREKAEYSQMTLQIEYEKPTVRFIGQYFTYDTLSYSFSDDFPPIDTLGVPPDISEDVATEPSQLFTPGLGTPLAVLTKKAIMLNLEKTYLDNQLKVKLFSLFDIYNPSDSTYSENWYFNNNSIWGSLIGFSVEYNISQNLNILAGVTEIKGDKKHPDRKNYRFNEMEDFAHYRFELKYSF